VGKVEVTEQTEATVDRRSFLERTVFGILSVIASTIGATSVVYLFRTPKTQQQVNWADAGELAGIAAPEPKEVAFERTSIDGWQRVKQKEIAWIVQNNDGSLIAFAPSCTHLGCAYHWDSNHDAFVCPCHGSMFSRTGRVIRGPATRPLDRYQVKRAGSKILLGPILRVFRS
jgi:menaquinol-cytochrome c reductase iron-sulfur subunit